MKPGFTIGSQGALAIWKPEIICIAYMVHNGNYDVMRQSVKCQNATKSTQINLIEVNKLAQTQNFSFLFRLSIRALLTRKRRLNPP